METNAPAGAAPAAVTTSPAIPVVERLTVPASSIFSDEERTLTPVKPAEAAPAAEKPAEAAPVEKPAEAAPAAEKPAEAAPVEKPAEAAPKAAEPVPAKIKIGGKEYTEKELEDKLAEREAAGKVAAAAAAPAAAIAPTKPAPTAEEIATAEKTWCDNFVKAEKLAVGLSNDEVETILSGGEDSAKLLSAKLTDIAAKAVLLARKSIFADLNPTLAEIHQNLQPVLQNAGQVEAAAAEQQFFTAYPEFKSHADVVRQIGNALLTAYPQQMSKMTREQQLAEVAAQTDEFLAKDFKRWNPAATGTWRDVAKTAPVTPAAPVAASPAPTALVAKVTPVAAPATKVQPPAANSPAANPAGGTASNWHKDTAKSLAD